jgi:hypothetical protein
MLAEFRPAFANYPFKSAMYSFNYGGIVALNLRWMRYPKGSAVRCQLNEVEALDERNSTLKDVKISAGPAAITIPTGMNTGDYAEYWAGGTIRVFDRNGVLLLTSPVNSGPQLKTGENKLAVQAAGPGTMVFTAITLGK